VTDSADILVPHDRQALLWPAARRYVRSTHRGWAPHPGRAFRNPLSPGLIRVRIP